jgi:hypothetical protein
MNLAVCSMAEGTWLEQEEAQDPQWLTQSRITKRHTFQKRMCQFE